MNSYNSFPHMYNGIPIILNDSLVDMVIDWSKIRSPSRAKRRLAKGIRKGVPMFGKPKSDIYVLEGKYIMHTETYKNLMKVVKRKTND